MWRKKIKFDEKMRDYSLQIRPELIYSSDECDDEALEGRVGESKTSATSRFYNSR